MIITKKVHVLFSRLRKDSSGVMLVGLLGILCFSIFVGLFIYTMSEESKEVINWTPLVSATELTTSAQLDYYSARGRFSDTFSDLVTISPELSDYINGLSESSLVTTPNGQASTVTLTGDSEATTQIVFLQDDVPVLKCTNIADECVTNPALSRYLR